MGKTIAPATLLPTLVTVTDVTNTSDYIFTTCANRALLEYLPPFLCRKMNAVEIAINMSFYFAVHQWDLLVTGKSASYETDRINFTDKINFKKKNS